MKRKQSYSDQEKARWKKLLLGILFLLVIPGTISYIRHYYYININENVDIPNCLWSSVSNWIEKTNELAISVTNNRSKETIELAYYTQSEIPTPECLSKAQQFTLDLISNSLKAWEAREAGNIELADSYTVIAEESHVKVNIELKNLETKYGWEIFIDE